MCEPATSHIYGLTSTFSLKLTRNAKINELIHLKCVFYIWLKGNVIELMWTWISGSKPHNANCLWLLINLSMSIYAIQCGTWMMFPVGDRNLVPSLFSIQHDNISWVWRNSFMLNWDIGTPIQKKILSYDIIRSNIFTLCALNTLSMGFINI